MRDGYVYLVQSVDHRWIKIGWTRDVASRMVNLAVSEQVNLTLLGSLRGTIEDERATHRRFAHLHVGLEWFEEDDEILDFAKSLPVLVSVSLVTAPQPDPEKLRLRLATQRKFARATQVAGDCRVTDGARNLRAWLTKQRLSVPVFCEKHGLDRIQVQRVLNGERWRRITVDFAYAIECATSGAVAWTSWLSNTGRGAVDAA